MNCPDCDKQIYSKPKCTCGWIKVSTRPEYQEYKPQARRARARPELVKACGDLFDKIMAGQLNRFEVSERLFELDKQFPGVGFGNIGHKKLKEWNDEGSGSV